MSARLTRRLVSALTVVTVAASVIVLAPTGPAQAASSAKPPAPQRYTDVPLNKKATVNPAKVATDPATVAAQVRRPAPVWPAGATSDVTAPAGKPIRVGNLPVLVAAGSGGVRQARVTVLDRAQTARTGLDGLVMKISTPQDTKPAPLQVSVEYGKFATAYGADWASRLRLVTVPDCAAGKTCAPVTLATTNNVRTQTVTASLTGVSAVSTTVALVASSSGQAGDFGASDLRPSSMWTNTGSAGGFSWSYPMQAPKPAAGPAPSVALSYASQSVDGRNGASNNQPGPIGEGFDFNQAYIERRYKACSDDMGGTANNTTKTGDLCWGTDNAVLSMQGRSGELLKATDGTWHVTGDDGSRIEHLTTTAFSNGAQSNEYWRLTTTDGTQYWFGRNQLPGWASGKATTNSVFTVPVYGNNTGEPCNKSTFATSSCVQAWRWNLDYVVDVNGNTMSYWYTKETNKYAQNGATTSPVAYDRGGYLTRVDYGTDNRDGTEYTGTAPDQVVFHNTDRCLATCTTKNGTTWPDTPWDLDCTAAPNNTNCLVGSPTFWASQRVDTVTTMVSGTALDKWTLAQSFPDPGDGTQRGLWLSSVTYTGLNGGSTPYPSVTFSGIQMPNRVDAAGSDYALAMNWWRVNDIKNETGGETFVTYSGPDCVAKTRIPTTPDNNTLRCYPVKWTPPGKTDDITDYCHKYLVTDVTQYDHAGGAKPELTHYDYLNTDNLPLWHYDQDDGLVPASKKSWAQWRGYPDVVTTVGGGSEQTKTETSYYRGMNGDLLANGTKRSVTVADKDGGSAVDYEAFAGRPREQISWNGSKIVDATVTDMWQSDPTASRTIGSSTVEARYTGASTVRQRTALDDGSWLRNKTVTSFGDYGQITQSADLGDESTTTDDQCTTTEYTRSTDHGTYDPAHPDAYVDHWLLDSIKRTHTWAGSCATEPTSSTQISTDTRFYYDGSSTYGAAPSKGQTTKTESIAGFTSGTPSYVTESTTKYDVMGRPTDVTDITGATTHTDYTPATGGPITKTVSTNALSWATTTLFDARGMPTKVYDPNQNPADTTAKFTEVAYDPAGRTTDIWSPLRPRATYPTSPTSHYDYSLVKNTDATTLVASVVTAKTLDANGNYRTTYTLYDGFTRTRQTQSTAYGGQVPSEKIVTDTFYDSAGRVWKTYDQHPMTGLPTGKITDGLSQDADIPRWTVNLYDAAGRTSATVQMSRGAEKWRTSTTYHGDHVEVTPPDGGTASATYYDARGRVVARRQYHGGVPSGTYDQTTTAYNSIGSLATVKDASGNTWTYTYDIRGRLTASTDPDHGPASTTYNDKDQTATVTDAEGHTVAYTYDVLGRKTSERDGSVTGTTRAAWTYDTPYKGATTTSTRYVGTDAYTTSLVTADAEYRPTQTRVSIPASEGVLAGDYSTRYTYRADGSPNAVFLPKTGDLPAETLTYEYDSTYALPTDLKTNYGGTGYYVSQATYTNLYEPSSIIRSQQLNSSGYVASSQYYDETTGRVNERLIGRETGPSIISDAKIGYSKAGDITSIDDNSSSGRDTQCFQYDDLRRLTEAWTPSSSDCSALPASAAALGGPAPYWQSYQFGASDDPIGRVGNRLKSIDHTTTGDATTSYTYPSAGANQPHTLSTETRTDGTGTATYGYQYDKDGNTKSRPGPNGQQTLTWDAEGKLATVTDQSGTSSYVYDANDNRLIARDPQGTTLDLGSAQVRLAKNATVATATRYYTFNGEVIGQRDATGLRWLASDYQGTGVIAVTADTQQTITQRRQTPYGESRGPGGVTWVNPKGFLNGDADSTGLTHLGAREYDPNLGRFISRDPIFDTTDSAQMNGYTYANDNPVTRTDPSGLDSCASGGQGCEWNNSCKCYLPPGGGDVHNKPTPEQPYTHSPRSNTRCGTACGSQPGGDTGRGSQSDGSQSAEANQAPALSSWPTPVPSPQASPILGGDTNSDDCDDDGSCVTPGMAKGGRQNVRDSGLRDVSDEQLKELERKATGQEKRRYQKELKARKLKHTAASDSRPKPTPGPGSNGSEAGSSDTDAAQRAATVTAVAGGVGVTIWWIGKLLSPFCGPAVPACVIVF